MMENAPVNVMMANRDFQLIYINPKSKQTLRGLEKYLPKPVDQLIGQSIDIFHKSPEHQRKMLADDRNLPHRAKIKVGPETLDLLVSPIYDNNKNFLGPMVTWEVVTEKLNLVKTLEETSAQLGAAAEELSATATQMSKNSTETADQSQNAAAASEEVSKGVQTVATNTEEMAASIKEIAKSSAEAADVSKDTLQRATDTNSMITQLGTSSQEIGNVIKVISSIAQQTNLLALNATIEAARAGEAGKGFAVVANEVKELAKQTAKATEDITNRIGAIQGDSKKAVESIGGIAKVIEKLNGISISIAAAVEEQTATTNEVSRVVQESSKGVGSIAETVKIVAAAAQQSSAGATQTLAAARSLADLATKLKELVKKIEV
jgi:methyl-accepting chemotaxis protein